MANILFNLKCFCFFKYNKLLIQKYYDVLGILPNVIFYNIFPKLILHWLLVTQNVVKEMLKFSDILIDLLVTLNNLILLTFN